MKKLTFALLAVFSINLFAHHDTDESDKNLLPSLLAAGTVIGGLEVAAQKFGMPESTAKPAQLVSAMIAVGKVTGKSAFTDYGLRIPFVLAAAKLAKTVALKNAVEAVPLGIGPAFKALGDSTKESLLAVATYTSLLYPVYSYVRDETPVGQFVVRGESN